MKSLRTGCLVLALGVFALPAAAQVPPSSADVAGYTGLHEAAHRGDVAAIARLVAGSHATLEARDSQGRTALHVATFARQPGAVKALLDSGADHGALEDGRYDAVTIAAVADDEETLRVLLAAGASPRLITSRYDGTALIAAAHLGHHGVVRQLIAAGAPLDHVNNLHWTAMIESIVLGDGGPRHLSTLQALIDAGANTRLADGEGRTPLQLARSRGYENMVRALVAAGDAGPAVAQAPARRAPDVPYDPTPHNVVAEILRLAQVREGDVVYDLGCGDGRIVIAAARERRARGVCVDIDPQRIRESRANAQAAGVAQRIRFFEQDLFATDIRDATVVVLFLWPDVNLKLRPRLRRELRPGTRVVSYVHDMGDWIPQQTVKVQGRYGERRLYLWIIGEPKGR